MLILHRVSTQDEGNNFHFGFNEAGLCVGETHIAKKLWKKLETLNSKQKGIYYYYNHLGLERDFSP